MTTLPATNNLWILLLIGGLIIAGFGFSKQSEFGSFLEAEDLKSNELTIKLNRITELSNEIERNDKKIDSLESIPEKNETKINSIINSNNSLIEQFNKELSVTKEKVNIHSSEFKIKARIYNKNKYEQFVLIIFGSILFMIGLINIMKSQVYRDKILYAEYLDLKVKQNGCQSCGMDLIYDLNFYNKSNYCSYCFDGSEFRNKEITLSEFQILIKEQMKAKGFKDSEIKNHLKKIGNLVRWRKKFNWDNNYT